MKYPQDRTGTGVTHPQREDTMTDTNPTANTAEVEADEIVDDQQDATTEVEDEGDKPLGPAGEKAYEAEKEKRRAATQKVRERDARIAELEQQLAAANGETQEERAQREAESAALAKANTRILKAEVRALAAGKLSDPSDALTFLDLDQFEVGDDGDVDQQEIEEAISDLLARKPYLAAQSGSKTPRPDPSQGARGAAEASTAQQFADAINF